METCPRCREVGACRCVPGLITPIPARPEGETARCSGCGDEYGHLGPCNPDPYMGSPTPAPASGEEELAWLRIRDVHQPQSGKSRCCGTWELVEPALLIAVRERDWILEAFARLTRELAGARGVVAQRSIETGQAMAERDAARAEAARMRDKVNDLMARLGRMCGDA